MTYKVEIRPRQRGDTSIYYPAYHKEEAIKLATEYKKRGFKVIVWEELKDETKTDDRARDSRLRKDPSCP